MFRKILILIYTLPCLAQTINIPTIWDQIAPIITSNSIYPQYTQKHTTSICAANALRLHGSKTSPIDSEFMQTIESLHILSKVLPKLDHNILQTGYFVFAKNICQITDNVAELQKRQDIATYFKQNPDLVNQIDHLLTLAQPSEIDYLFNFYPKMQDNQQSLQDCFLQKIIDFYQKLQKKIDSHKMASEYFQRTMQISTVAGCFLLLRYLTNYSECRKDAQMSGYLYFKKIINSKDASSIASSPFVSEPLTILTLLLTITQVTNSAINLKMNFDTIHQKQKSLILIRKLISITEEINSLLQKHPTLKKSLPSNSIIEKFANSVKNKKNPGISAKMSHFLNLLHSSTFTGNPSYLISFQGKIIETYSLYEDLKHEFIELLEALAEIDSQLCIYKLLTSTSQSFCQPILVESARPILHIENYWHPEIAYEKAVKNSLFLGDNKKPQNVIITGANAGGKTTALTAIMIAQILTQSIGIAPAKYMKVSPFSRLHTYLDLTTNLSAQESLFMAQANRAQKLYNSILSCKSDEKSFTILDEIFTGTRADFAAHASCEFAKKLAALPNSISMIATHFPQLTELEKLNLFMNYHAADGKINSDGSINYPYLIIPGISHQNIAQHILKQKNIL